MKGCGTAGVTLKLKPADYVIMDVSARIEFRASFKLSQLIIPPPPGMAPLRPRNREYQISRCYLLRFARSARFPVFRFQNLRRVSNAITSPSSAANRNYHELPLALPPSPAPSIFLRARSTESCMVVVFRRP